MSSTRFLGVATRESIQKASNGHRRQRGALLSRPRRRDRGESLSLWSEEPQNTKSVVSRLHSFQILQHRNHGNLRFHSTMATASSVIKSEDDDDEEIEPAQEHQDPPKPWLTAACGPFPKDIQNQAPILRDTVPWEIPHPDDSAGSVFLGPNGIGKSQLTQALVHATKWYEDHDDNKSNTRKKPFPPRVQHVSFEAHQELLQDPNCGVYRTVADGGQMNKAAQFLIVRLGLYGLLNRNVATLSTGEIRKVLLVRALSRRPDLLILDNALDGLDVASRDHLKDILHKTLAGFRNDILVQGVSAKAAARTQVMLLTHRPEEVLGDRVTYPVLSATSSALALQTEPIHGRSGEEVLELAMQATSNNNEDGNNQRSLKDLEPWDDPTWNVTTSMIQSWWALGRSSTPWDDDPIVNANGLFLHRTKRDEDGSPIQVTLLHDLRWSILPGQSWLLAGHNGAGKSTLSRLLVQQGSDAKDAMQKNHLAVPPPERIGWCSTELHMQMASSTDSALSVLTRRHTTDRTIAMEMADWMLLPGDDDEIFWDRAFHTLSQGQQKMVLISAAMASRPELLILDEPCQGLDMVHRRRVLAMMEKLCSSTNVSLIYTTHHLEEVVPAIQNVLHLEAGRSVYNGSLAEYNPAELSNTNNN